MLEKLDASSIALCIVYVVALAVVILDIIV